MQKNRWLIAIALVLAMVAAACGGGDEETTTTTTEGGRGRGGGREGRAADRRACVRFIQKWAEKGAQPARRLQGSV